MITGLTVGLTTCVRPDLLRVAIETMYAYAPFPDVPYPFRIVVVNNGGEDAFSDLNVEVIHNKENRGVSYAINQILEQVDTDYFVHISDDVMFVPGIPSFWNTLHLPLLDPTVGFVGPVSDGVLNCQRAAFICDEPYLHASYLHGLFLFGLTSTWREVGGMDENCEGVDEVDLALRTMAAGYKLIINRRLFVHHDKSASIRTFTSEQLQARRDRANQFFKKKYSDYKIMNAHKLPGHPSVPDDFKQPPVSELWTPRHVFTSFRSPFIKDEHESDFDYSNTHLP